MSPWSNRCILNLSKYPEVAKPDLHYIHMKLQASTGQKNSTHKEDAYLFSNKFLKSHKGKQLGMEEEDNQKWEKWSSSTDGRYYPSSGGYDWECLFPPSWESLLF